MADILASLSIFTDPVTLLYLVGGVTAGFVVAVLPGFNATNALAILLPLMVTLPLDQSLVLIAAIYAGAEFAGGVPAIILNVPGTGSSAATALDGYPMARQGRAEEAIGIARMASVLGGVIGCLICIPLLAPMADIALRFGSAEMFLLAVLGLTVVASVTGNSFKKGIISALLGFSIATASANAVTGQPRFNLGFSELYDSVPFVPVMIGLFAVGHMMELARQDRVVDMPVSGASSAGTTTVREKIRASVREFGAGVGITLRKPKVVLRASLIGTGIGAIPGAGTSVSTFVAYADAKRASKTPERFGKGEPEGVMAAESADNATTAGTMVPTLALGIPGSAAASILLAAMLVRGVIPGPNVLSDYGAEAYGVMFALLFASLLILPLGVLFATPLTYLTRVPTSILVPCALLVSMIGAYASRRLVFDMAIALVFGLVAIAMKAGGYPVVPMVLGLVLGPIAESNFLRAMAIGQNDLGYFFSPERPIAIVLWVLIVLSIGYSVKGSRKGRRANDESKRDLTARSGKSQ